MYKLEQDAMQRMQCIADNAHAGTDTEKDMQIHINRHMEHIHSTNMASCVGKIHHSRAGGPGREGREGDFCEP